MRKTNALLIQETLKQRKYISIPWLQLEYDLTYLEAREFLKQMILRGWVASEPTGIHYSVRRKQLCLRKIRRDEVDGLYNDLTADSILALTCIEKQAGTGANFQDLERAVRGEDDTEAALQILNKHKLIYQADDLYFLAISKQAAQVLWAVDMEKRKSAIRRKMSDSAEIEEKIKKLFNALFDD